MNSNWEQWQVSSAKKHSASLLKTLLLRLNKTGRFPSKKKDDIVHLLTVGCSFDDFEKARLQLEKKEFEEKERKAKIELEKVQQHQKSQLRIQSMASSIDNRNQLRDSFQSIVQSLDMHNGKECYTKCEELVKKSLHEELDPSFCESYEDVIDLENVDLEDSNLQKKRIEFFFDYVNAVVLAFTTSEYYLSIDVNDFHTIARGLSFGTKSLSFDSCFAMLFDLIVEYFNQQLQLEISKLRQNAEQKRVEEIAKQQRLLEEAFQKRLAENELRIDMEQRQQREQRERRELEQRQQREQRERRELEQRQRRELEQRQQRELEQPERLQRLENALRMDMEQLQERQEDENMRREAIQFIESRFVPRIVNGSRTLIGQKRILVEDSLADRVACLASISDIEEKEEGKACVVCLTNQKVIMLRNCNHLCLCVRCTIAMFVEKGNTKCPMCKSHVSDIMQVFS